MLIDQTFLIINATLFTLFALITIVFALAVIVTILLHWRSQFQSVANLLTCNSSLALIFYAVAISIQIPSIIERDPEPSSMQEILVCKTRAFLITYATAVKTYSYLVHAISRFSMTVLHQHRYLHTFRATGLMIVASWLVSGIIAGGMFISPTAYLYETASHLCGLSTRSFLSSFIAIVVIFFTTVSTVFVLYGIIVCHTIRHGRVSLNSAHTLHAQRSLKVFKKILILLQILIIGGGPYVLSMLLNVFHETPWQMYSISILFIDFAAATQAVAIFCINKQVRKICLGMIGCRKGFSLTGSMEVTMLGKTNRVVPFATMRLPTTA